jgi:hypothetical protein
MALALVAHVETADDAHVGIGDTGLAQVAAGIVGAVVLDAPAF